MSDSRPLLFLGCVFLCFGAMNTYIGFQLLGERGIENKVRVSRPLFFGAAPVRIQRLLPLAMARLF